MESSHAPVKVFLADDSLLIRQRVGAMLAACAMKVVGEGESLQNCISGILRSNPDVVVLDVQLEGGTGLQVLQAVKREHPDVAFVVFSNNSGPAYRKRYLAEGAKSFLDKATEFDQLVQAVNAALPRSVH